MRVISFGQSGKFEAELQKLETRSAVPNPEARKAAQRILRTVRAKGDAAVLQLALKFGELDAARTQHLQLAKESFRVPQSVMQRALEQVSSAFRDAIEFAANNIRTFSQWQMPRPFLREICPGVTVGQMIKPLESVGCYVPGGRYPLPSTMLMTVIPAQVAGVKRAVVCSPKPSLETLAVAALLGVEEFYAIGGAHAIAALAYGTNTVARVLKIAGPGNSFVTAAKQIVSAEGPCSIDMLAGPTEVLIAVESGDAAVLASDLVSQAEHDPEALCLFVSSSERLVRAVVKQAEKQAQKNKVAAASLKRNGVAFITASHEQTREIASRIASEHTTVSSMSEAERLRSAGSVFVGDYSAQAFGDYVSGPNHTLPTGANARVRGGLSVYDFLKIVTVQQVGREGTQQLAGAGLAIAQAEGLIAHAASIAARIEVGHARA